MPRATPGLPRMELAAWGQYGVVAGITTRHDDFNLGLNTMDPAERVLSRWRRLLAAFRPAFLSCHVGLQVHGARVAVHEGSVPGWVIHEETDGHVSRAPSVLLCVTVADCIPVFLLHPPSRTVGLLHAGWRGIAAGILERGVERVAVTAGAPSADVIMHCGVGICGECYEVGSEVFEALRLAAGGARARVDLRGELVRRARAADVGEVSVSGWCSAHDDAHFFSHRRSGGRDGRMVAFLGVPGG